MGARGAKRACARVVSATAAVLLAAWLAGPSPASARPVSDAQKERIEKAFAEFQKRGDVPDASVPRTPWDKAFERESAFYKIRTNTSPDVANYIGTLMDAQAVALRKIFQFRMTLKKINIWATRTRADFVDVALNELRVPIGSSTGGFWTTARGGTICLPYVRQGNLHPGSVMMHEATHQFLNAAMGHHDTPIWLNEGLAVLFEECKYNPVEGKLEVFVVPRMRLVLLQAEMKRDLHVKLGELLTTRQTMFTARHYAAAWSFIYWIFRSAGEDEKETLRRQKAFNTYLYDVKVKKTDVARLFNYLGMNQESVQKEWKDWVLKLDPDDELGGTRLKGEPPYEPKPRRPAEDRKPAPGDEVLPEEMRKAMQKMLDDPRIPESIKEKIREKLRQAE